MRRPRNPDKHNNTCIANPNKHSTFDATYKLMGSIPLPRKGRNVPTMDQFISRELQGKIINERNLETRLDSNSATRHLSFFLDVIFASVNKIFLDVDLESITVPLSSIPVAARQFLPSFKSASVSDLIELYDERSKRWRWNLPLIDPIPETPPSVTLTESTDISGDPEPSAEHHVAQFLNTLADAFAASGKRISSDNSLPSRRNWCANWSKTPLPGSAGCLRKPDLILVDDPLPSNEVTWLVPKVVAEYTKENFQPASRIGKTIDTKAYLTLVEQPWRRFVLGLSIANADLRVHFYDHSGGALSPPFNIHANAKQFLAITLALAFGCPSAIGFDLTIEISPPPLPNRKDLENASSPQDDADPVEKQGEWSLSHPPHGAIPQIPPQLLPQDPAEEQGVRPFTHSPHDPNPRIPPRLLPDDADPVEEQLLTPPSRDPIPPIPPQLVESTSAPSLGGSPQLAEGPEPAIGKIRVGDIYYEIVEILFSSTGFLGRGTVVYLVRLDGVHYVIKDLWVKDLASEGIRDPRMIHEAKMMDLVQGIDGVPKLHAACVVEVEEGIPDTTTRYRPELCRTRILPRTHVRLVMSPCARPLTMFKTKKELVKSVRDILRIIAQADQRGVLHRDCSILNTMIEDIANGASRGFLLDWEFAVEVTHRGEYDVGGTGTLPFMSVNLLRQLQLAYAKSKLKNSQSIRKTLALTRVLVDDPITIRHSYADDVESLLYVLTWIIVMYEGPDGKQRSDTGHEETFLSLWSEKAANDLIIAQYAKFSFLVDVDPMTLEKSVTPYCRDLVPLVHSWRAVHRQAILNDTQVAISDIDKVLHDFIEEMPDEPVENKKTPNSLVEGDSPMANRKKILRNLAAGCPSLSTPLSPVLPPITTLLDSQKRLRDEVRSMDNLPLPNKRFKRDLL